MVKIFTVTAIRSCRHSAGNGQFIFQQFNLLPVLTAKENIIMPLLLDKQKPDEAYLKQLTELLGIQGALGTSAP